ncbi:MAG TPA: aldolase/citrate lyase family protein [Nitrososphaerales archaeon]|nr:aldolase/citrate lyase family protein [Nitrososphaerales archaeon]
MKNKLKERLYAGNSCLGTWITIGNPDIVDILKNLPFEWFMFDMEHSYFSFESVKTMMQALGEGPTPMVRIGQVDQLLAKRALDIGSQGLLVPLVNSKEEAERLVKYSMYPPSGVRGAGPGRASKFGMNLPEYLRTANQELLLAVQIETTEALSKVDEILDAKGIDIGFVGPTDLTISLGLVDDRSNPKIIEAMERVIRSCKAHGKIPGTLAVSVEEARKFLKLGFQFISLASDSRFLSYGARSYLEAKN